MATTSQPSMQITHATSRAIQRRCQIEWSAVRSSS